MLVFLKLLGPSYLRRLAHGGHEVVRDGTRTRDTVEKCYELSQHDVHHDHCDAGSDSGENSNNFEDIIDGTTVSENPLDQ